MKKFYLSAVAAVALLASSCAMVSTPVGSGAIYTNVASGEIATSNTTGKKVGVSTATNILGVYAAGDASIDAAAKSAGIKKISHVDSKKMSILGLYSTHTTVVYGD